MNTLEFLQRVLPTEGFYVTTVINEDGNRQGFYKTVKELSKVSESLGGVTSYTHKIPAVINGETYYLLLKQ